MELRQAYLAMIRAFPGGWSAMAAALGFSKDALENRIYERKGQMLHVDTALQMQATSGTTHFAEAIAQVSGGVFMQLPPADGDRDELLRKFNLLYAELGEMSADFQLVTAHDELDEKGRVKLEGDAQKIHRTLEELIAVVKKVYCRHHD